MTKLDKIRTHISENRKVYIAAGIGVVVGGSAVAATLYGRSIVVNDSLNVSINSPKTNVVVQMVRPGPKSYAIQCLENQQAYPSLRQAAKELGVNASEISKHLKGERDAVCGLHFVKRAEL